MTIAIKPTASGSTIEQNGSTILTVDGSGNITPSNQMYPKVPTFSAALDTNTNITTNTATKIPYNVVNFDTNSNYDNTTNYRFTPTVAGYYQINATISMVNVTSNVYISIYKNGSEYLRGNQDYHSPATRAGLSVSDVVYCNGSTDYIEMYAIHGTGSTQTLSGITYINKFSAALVSV